MPGDGCISPLYFANVPDNQGKVYMYDNKSELVEAMPMRTRRFPPRWDLIENPVDENEMDLTAGFETALLCKPDGRRGGR